MIQVWKPAVNAPKRRSEAELTPWLVTTIHLRACWCRDFHVMCGGLSLYFALNFHLLALRLVPPQHYQTTQDNMFQFALSILVQLSLLSLAAAAPITTQSHGYEYQWQHGAGGGVVGLIVLILDIIALGSWSCLLSCSSLYLSRIRIYQTRLTHLSNSRSLTIQPSRAT